MYWQDVIAWRKGGMERDWAISAVAYRNGITKAQANDELWFASFERAC